MAVDTDLFPRSCGVLLHPTSLPGPDGIGDLGPGAHRFVEWLERTGQGIWQILPLGPTGYGDSPYQALSAFAGNPLLVDLEAVAAAGWLTADDLAGRPMFSEDRVDFGLAIAWKTSLLDRAWERFDREADAWQQNEFTAWCDARSAWLPDYALFMALKEDLDGRPWTEWPAGLRDRDPAALQEAAGRLADRIGAHRFRQWLFFAQWSRLKSFAAGKGVRLIGDVPIFVAHDSSDVWARRELFRLGEDGRPTAVAGVPPDYFSETGQLWGNPLYDWERLAEDGYAWWGERLKASLELVDVVRLDHFRGFEAYWEVPAGAATAEKGRWVPGPGADFFTAMRAALDGRLPVIAEDLGVITPEVEELRDAFDLPGMKVLQFAWSGPENLFLPHHHGPNAVVYSGTHDNDPTLGWWRHLADAATRELVAEYSGGPVDEPHWTLIRLGMASCAHTFIATMQDVLGLGREARMNLPGEAGGNWSWRMPRTALTDPAADRLSRLAWLYCRRAGQETARRDDPERPEEGRFS
jgi:4-alpha-glucanotransferase